MSACSTGHDQADKIIHGGTVVTVDDSKLSAEAIAIKDGKIVAVGSEAKVMAWRGDDSEVIDIEGRTVVPGFIDGHSHFVAFGAQAVGANLLAPPDGQFETIDDLVDALKSFANGPDVDRTGSIEVGKLADLVILSDNPLTVGSMNIGELRVLAAIKEGKTVFRTD